MVIRFILLPLLATAPVLCRAQQVVAGGGGHHANAANAITYTIGEPVIATVSAAGSTLTQGFNQPWADIGTLVDDLHGDGPAINVYPNPVRHTLHIALDTPTEGQRYSLHDAAGRLVTDGRISSTITDIDMEPYSSGSYFLRVLGPADSNERTFQINVTR